MTDFVLVAIFALILGLITGWATAHSTVAVECDRLGAFYVGTITYRCSKEVAK